MKPLFSQKSNFHLRPGPATPLGRELYAGGLGLLRDSNISQLYECRGSGEPTTKDITFFHLELKLKFPSFLYIHGCLTTG